jgi:hypothetical protein
MPGVERGVRGDRGADSLAGLTKAALKFRDEREWKQFHNFKDLAITLTLESAEVLEHAQWKTAKELEAHLSDSRQREHVADEWRTSCTSCCCWRSMRRSTWAKRSSRS